MINIKNLEVNDLMLISEFMYDNEKNFNKFSKIGWTYKNIEKHFYKSNNYSIGCFINNKICGILIGEKIENQINFDLDIHIIFVSNNYRRKKIGSKIMNFIESNNNFTKISKIFLEVSEKNSEAIKFYEKNNFVFLKFRHNYYKDKEKYIKAKCYFKNI